MERCPWCMCNEKMIRYHDEEWGVPVHDDQKQFEFLMMEVMQCHTKDFGNRGDDSIKKEN